MCRTTCSRPTLSRAGIVHMLRTISSPVHALYRMFKAPSPAQVLYHMFEAYVEMGENNITALDVAAGLLKFLIVALGGTLVGIIWGFLTAFVTR